MLLTTLVLHLLLGRYMVAAEVGARAAAKGSMANGGRNSVWISASGSLGTVSVGRRYAAAARRLVHVLVSFAGKLLGFGALHFGTLKKNEKSSRLLRCCT